MDEIYPLITKKYLGSKFIKGLLLQHIFFLKEYSLNFSNGDILYARLVSKDQSMSIANASLTTSQNVVPQDKTAEDEVDVLLKRETGLIHRNRHPQL